MGETRQPPDAFRREARAVTRDQRRRSDDFRCGRPDVCERQDEENEEWPPFVDAFTLVHRFILKAIDGNAAAANALFQKFLNGELPDELLRISRSWVQEEHQGNKITVVDTEARECFRRDIPTSPATSSANLERGFALPTS